MSYSSHESDAWLDAQLQEVPLPEGLLDRLRQVALWEEDALDAAIRDVPIPEGLLHQLYRLPRAPSWELRIQRWATAVGLFLAFGLWYFGLVISMVGSLQEVSQVERGKRNLSGLSGTMPEPVSVDLVFSGVERATDSEASLAGEGEIASAAADVKLPLVPEHPSSRGTWDWGSTGWQLPRGEGLLDKTLVQWPMMTSPVGMDWEDLWTVPLPSPRGIDPPLAPGFPWGDYRRWGVHPFVIPAVHPSLRVSEIPLGIDAASFELARMYLLRGMLPPPEAIRTEEFLAAIDYGYAMPGSGEQMRLSVLAGPSAFRGGQFHMLQVGVQAEVVRSGDRPGTRATLLLDCSSSMQWGARWDLIVQALQMLQSRLGPKDRINVVIFDVRAFPVAEDLTREDFSELIEVLRRQEPSGSTNAAEGLRHGYALARRYARQDGRNNRVILLTDGLVVLDPAMASRMESLLAEAAEEGIPLDVVDLGQERLDDQPEPYLVRLSEQGRGKVYRATSAKQIVWALLESITGQSQRVATEVRLRVVFNPKAVISYRVLGHEAKAIIGLKPPRLATDFYSGQSGTALYEVRLASGPGEEVIATAELSWKDARTGQPRSVQQKLLRKQVAGSVLQSPLPLQAAMVAAQTAELLRESPFAGWIPTASNPKLVLEAARQMDSRIQAWPSVQQMTQLLEKAVTAKPYRPGGIR